MKTSRPHPIRIFLFLALLISCQKSEVAFDELTKFLKTELVYTGTIQYKNILIINLNTCSVCIERIAKILQDFDKKSNLL
ncbi:MAG: hypothetical protein U1E02_17735, partial [Hydrogenophaga sp.]|nr:hypothetical protein [Hydrogenophaga sp.]